MTFDQYLTSKKIDSKSFRKSEADLWNEFQSLFDQMHPNSFTSQKLFLINGIRRRYPMPIESAAEKTENSKPKVAKPVMKPKPVGAKKAVVKPKTNVAKKPVIKPKPIIKPKKD